MKASVFNYQIVKDPEIFEQNRLPAHSDHLFYRNSPGDCEYCLNGQWKFAFAGNYEQSIKGFEAVDYDCHGWAQIPVPAHIQLQGYDTPQYVNTQYPWDGHEAVRPGQIPVQYNPTASYVKYFDVPQNMKGQPLFISFRGVESAFALWLNGQYVGYSEDSFTPADFDLTPYVTEGENKLAVQVFKWCSGSWCEDQDFFRFSGIFRDVILYVKPACHIEDLKIRTILDDTYQNASLELELKTKSAGDCRAVITLTDAEGKKAADIVTEIGKGSSCSTVSLPATAPHLWSAEDPYLYDLKIDLKDGGGETTEIVTEKVGFRRFEIRDAIMHLNGKRIVFKGVNRHEFCAKSGRVIDDEIIRTDLITMKRNNINAVRTSHYPNRTALYRLCDRLGLYVIDETNLETHGCWDPIEKGKEDISFAVPGDRPEFEQMVLDRANSMYQRDKNHPCILIWSCGNESFGGKNLQKMADQFHAFDPGRPVHYEGVFHDRRYPVSDMESTMYATVEDIRSFLKEHRDKPYINCEYAHAMGNSCGALEKYTTLTEEDPLFQGGFIWDYIDQCLEMTDRYKKTFMAYGGDHGERPHDGNFSGNGIVYGDDRTPSPKMQEVKYCYQNIKARFEPDGSRVRVRNGNLFLSTDAYAGTLSVEAEGEMLLSLPWDLSVEAGEEKTFDLPGEIVGLTKGNDGKEKVITLSFALREDTLWAKAGHEVAYAQLAIRHAGEGAGAAKNTDTAGKAADQTGSGRLEVVRGWNNIGVRGEGFELLFSELLGGLISCRYSGSEVLDKMVLPNFWRAMTDNDVANQLAKRAGIWKAGSMFVSHKYHHGTGFAPCMLEQEAGEDGDRVKITYTYYPAVPGKIRCTLAYTVHANGWIDVEQSMPDTSLAGQIPEFSVLWPLNADYDRLTWYGPGPEETYRDKTHGKLGVWSGRVADQMARYLRPQECGWKENARWAKVTDESGRGLLFEMEPDTGLGFSALPYSPQQLDDADHPGELPDSYHTWVRVGMQMGVGGDDTWGALVHPEYLLDNSKEMKIRFRVRGI